MTSVCISEFTTMPVELWGGFLPSQITSKAPSPSFTAFSWTDACFLFPPSFLWLPYPIRPGSVAIGSIVLCLTLWCDKQSCIFVVAVIGPCNAASLDQPWFLAPAQGSAKVASEINHIRFWPRVHLARPVPEPSVLMAAVATKISSESRWGALMWRQAEDFFPGLPPTWRQQPWGSRSGFFMKLGAPS